MKKRILIILLILGLILSLVACGGNNEEAEKPSEEVAQETEEIEKEPEKEEESEEIEEPKAEIEEEPKVEEKEEKPEEVVEENSEIIDLELVEEADFLTREGREAMIGQKTYDEGLGYFGLVDAKVIDEVYESGPMVITVTDAYKIQLELEDPEMIEAYENKNLLRCIVIDVIIENTSDQDLSFYPNVCSIITNTVEEAESSIMDSTNMSGIYEGAQREEGMLFFIIDSRLEDITEIKLLIDPPVDDDYNKVGEGYEIQIYFD